MVQINDENPNLPEHAAYEWIDVQELARRLHVDSSSIYEYTRNRCSDPIPHKFFGKRILFPWGSPKLEEWWQRRPERRASRTSKVSKQRNEGEFKRKDKK